jgi:hypothetical protein
MNVHGARNALSHSIAKRLQVRTLHKRDQVVAPGDGVNLFNYKPSIL